MYGDKVKLELSLTEGEWIDLTEALTFKARLVKEGYYGDFDPHDGFDPDHVARDLEALSQKIQDRLDEAEG